MCICFNNGYPYLVLQCTMIMQTHNWRFIKHHLGASIFTCPRLSPSESPYPIMILKIENSSASHQQVNMYLLTRLFQSMLKGIYVAKVSSFLLWHSTSYLSICLHFYFRFALCLAHVFSQASYFPTLNSCLYIAPHHYTILLEIQIIHYNHHINI